MIIKPKAKRDYALIPNELINDNRISIETRGMIAYLLAKPPNWQIRSQPLARDLGLVGKGLGRKRINRILNEAISAGYMARSIQQTHHPDGWWGPFDYIVGMPKDVAVEVQRRGGEKYGGSAPRALTHKAQADKGHTNKSKNYKSNIDNNYRPPNFGSARQTYELSDRTNHVGCSSSNGTTVVNSKNIEQLINVIMELRECSREEAVKILSSLPDAGHERTSAIMAKASRK